MDPCDKIVGPCINANTGEFHGMAYQNISETWMAVGAVILVATLAVIVLYYGAKGVVALRDFLANPYD